MIDDYVKLFLYRYSHYISVPSFSHKCQIANFWPMMMKMIWDLMWW